MFASYTGSNFWQFTVAHPEKIFNLTLIEDQ